MTTTTDAPEDGRPRDVIAAIARCMAEMPGVPKGEQMSSASGGYRYRGIEAITAAAQHVLGRNGVVIVPTVKERQVATIMMNGKPWTEDQLVITYRLYGPGGLEDFVEAGPFYALARDNSDKGTNKAMTQAFKQMLLQVLCIGDNNDDPDSYAAQDRDVPAMTAEQWSINNGWEGLEAREQAKQSVRTALSALVEHDHLDRERAAELFREYQHPDGEASGPRPRSRSEHLAYWNAYVLGDDDGDNPLDPPPAETDPTSSPAAAEPPSPPRNPDPAASPGGDDASGQGGLPLDAPPLPPLR